MSICTGYNNHIIQLLSNQQILWKLKLRSGLEIWSDFDSPENGRDPWTRAKSYLGESNEDLIKISVIVPGQPETTVFSNEAGLDRVFIMRGSAKNITDSEETLYSFMSFGMVENDGLIHVKRFFWPDCAFLKSEEVREITPENEKLLYVKK